MARRIIWTRRAQRERTNILDFWIRHNKNNSFSRKLNTSFEQAVDLIKHHPRIGRPTDIDNVRVKIVRDYLMFYEITSDTIYILTIWDNRQDPEKQSF